MVAAGALGVCTAGLLGLLAQFEGTQYTPYRDPIGVLTVCRGVTNGMAPGWVVPGRRYSEAECQGKEQELLRTVVFPALSACLNRPVYQQQYSALADFAWNVGPVAVCKSTLMRKLNAGDCVGAQQEFNRWVYAGGRKYAGLVRRADARAAMFGSECP